AGSRLKLEGPEAQHMLRVMRKKVGDEVTLFDGQGQEMRASIVECDRRRADLELQGEVHIDPPRPGHLELAIALPRGGEVVEVVRRAIEAGADVIRPLIASRSVHRADKKSEEKRIDKMNQAAITALKQCGRNSLPRFTAPTKLIELSIGKDQTGVFGSTYGGVNVRQFEKSLGGVPRNMVIVVGPEGGLTDQETEHLNTIGFTAVSLGSLVYRVETAAIALLSYFSSAAEDEFA
ncbi:MAG: 16S rRNA (uracil1498-N3)-methyltransferase, partial [Planctomycetota bacterium]